MLLLLLVFEWSISWRNILSWPKIWMVCLFPWKKWFHFCSKNFSSDFLISQKKSNRICFKSHIFTPFFFQRICIGTRIFIAIQQFYSNGSLNIHRYGNGEQANAEKWEQLVTKMTMILCNTFLFSHCSLDYVPHLHIRLDKSSVTRNFKYLVGNYF